MYQVHQSDKGYLFTTEAGVNYLVYFTRITNPEKYLTKNTLIDNYFYFGVERISAKVGGKDRHIKMTIASIIMNFFINNDKSILIFNYSCDDDRVKGRRKLFYSWFEELSTHTTYQFYQHDFLDSATVCALFKRTGAKEFDLLRQEIKDSLANLETSTKNNL
jgi:hypothetical protein